MIGQRLRHQRSVFPEDLTIAADHSQVGQNDRVVEGDAPRAISPTRTRVRVHDMLAVMVTGWF